MRRFFYHYYKQYGCLSIHYNKQCTKVDEIVCNVPTETKWNKTQPKLVVRGFAKKVEIKKVKNKVIATID